MFVSYDDKPYVGEGYGFRANDAEISRLIDRDLKMAALEAGFRSGLRARGGEEPPEPSSERSEVKGLWKKGFILGRKGRDHLG